MWAGWVYRWVVYGAREARVGTPGTSRCPPCPMYRPLHDELTLIRYKGGTREGGRCAELFMPASLRNAEQGSGEPTGPADPD